jgi:hypothetical protein
MNQVFVYRELGADMDMAVYNKMIQIQQNPKFSRYFHEDPVPVGRQ